MLPVKGFPERSRSGLHACDWVQPAQRAGFRELRLRERVSDLSGGLLHRADKIARAFEKGDGVRGGSGRTLLREAKLDVVVGGRRISARLQNAVDFPPEIVESLSVFCLGLNHGLAPLV